ncbi:DNA-directed RNA polymerase subunit delta [Virgibacillus alimentarius]|uniref:Probable DNA-directed RNA polymerase subunit delta n=1 Tax=Virgibacillus alimentarius TaxID=698769 RepID=A0ABS4SAF7_9BACI|nr:MULTISPECIES: DNA-directed RNA polymerase subunit delta [Virgibacillus]MBP2257990.1 DNA-directed RNA polymerase subunit delta [Virgibacillus alimentarius]HLR67263.1 DNA-directed RNA polymerase subunit delta [Virgibacillus sp.]
MGLQNYGHEELQNMSMIELGRLILIDEQKAMDFKEVFNKIAEIKEFTESQTDEKIVTFYTDLNLDGRFLTLGSGMWGLKRWYPVEKIDETLTATPKKKKKKTAKKKKNEKAEKKVTFEDEKLDIEEDFGDFDEESNDEQYEKGLDENLDEEFGDEDFDDDEEEK